MCIFQWIESDKEYLIIGIPQCHDLIMLYIFYLYVKKYICTNFLGVNYVPERERANIFKLSNFNLNNKTNRWKIEFLTQINLSNFDIPYFTAFA